MARRATAYAGVVLGVLGVLGVLCLLTPIASAQTEVEQPGPVDLGGSRVEVSTDAGNPTELTAGLWADTLTGPGADDANAHWFSYDRTMEYSSVLVGVVATSPEAYGDSIEVVTSVAGGTACAADSSSSGSPVSGSAFGAIVAVPDNELGKRDDPCAAADTVLIRVSRGDGARFEGDLPIALRVVEEAPVVSTEDELPAVVDRPTVSIPSTRAARPLAGGTGFDDAPELGDGETVSDAVPEGGEHLYRVRLGWGQALAVRVDVAARDEAASAALDNASPAVDLTLFDPLRNSFDTGFEIADTDGRYDDEGAMLVDGTLAVRYLNRFDDALMSVPGDYWVSVSVEPATDRAPVDVPIELTLDVVGAPGEAPRFQGVVLDTDGNAGPADYDPTTPYLVDGGVFSADVSGTPRVAGDTASGGDDRVRRTAGLAVGAASLLCCLAGVVLLRRRVSRPAAR